MPYVAPKSITVRDGGATIELFQKKTAEGVVLYAPSPEKEAELRERYRKMRGCPPRSTKVL